VVLNLFAEGSHNNFTLAITAFLFPLLAQTTQKKSKTLGLKASEELFFVSISNTKYGDKTLQTVQ